jgi:hypothetical protein
MRLHAAWLVVGLALLNSCATVIHGPFQEVQIESSPPGATAIVSPMLSERGPQFLDPTKQYTVTTPATVRLRRDNTYRVELAKPGYKIATTKVVSSYDWLWAPVMCGPCEMVGELPTYDLRGRALPLRFVEATFYECPRGFFRALGRGFRVLSPEALLGTSFKLKSSDAGFFGDWHALAEPRISSTLETSEK